MNRKLHKLAIEGIAFQGLSMFLGLAWVSALAHKLPAPVLGKILVALSVANTIVTLCGFGIQHAVAVKAGNYDDRVIVSNGLTSILFLGSISSVVAFVVAKIAASETHLDVTALFCAVTVFLISMNVHSSALIRAIHRFRISNISTVLQAGIFNLLLLSCFVVERNLTTQNVMALFMLSSAFASIFAFSAILRTRLFDLKFLKSEIIKDIVGFGGKVQLGNVLKETMYKADLYLVSWLLGSASAGLYAVVLKVIEGLGRFVDAVGLVILSLISRSNNAERNKLTMSVMVFVIPVSCLTALGVSIFSEGVISILFGPEFEKSGDLLEIGIFALIPLAVWKLLANDFIGRGFVSYYTVSVAVGSSFIIMSNYATLESYGVSVASVNLVLSYVIAAFILVISAAYKLQPVLRGSSNERVE